MQTKLLSVLVAATVITCGVRGQDTGVATPSSPAPAVQPPQQSASAGMATTAGAMPAPNQIIYAPRLPTAAELTNAAAAQGLAVDQISQTANQVTVVYRYANGQTNVVAYQLLPTNPVPTTTTSTTMVVVPAPAPTVVYETAPRVIYYEEPYCYPRYYYPPVSVHLGFGYYRGWGGGHHWR